jgi:hypothetical protein
MVFCPRHSLHAFSVETARKEDCEHRRALNQIEAKPPGRWGNAVEQHASPAVKNQ